MSEQEIICLLPSLQWALLCYQYGKLDEFIAAGNQVLHEEYYACFWDALELVSDFFNAEYDETREVERLYLGFESMSEFYRLCRTYSVRHGIPLKENPYMIEAERSVAHAMSLCDNYGGYAFVLQTKINHKWASGLLILLDENYFNSELKLVEAIFSIAKWYHDALERLKNDLQCSQTPEKGARQK
jgi:hypothetical protein